MLNSLKRIIKTSRLVTSSTINSLAMSSSQADKFGLPGRYEGSLESVWVEYIALALKYKPLNLGQGFPDYSPPSYVTKVRYLIDFL